MLMKSKFFFISLSLIFSFIFNTLLIANEQFNFNVTEVEIRENGNKFIGRKRGVATTEDGLFIEADEFEYDKKLNILQVKGKIEFNEKEQNFKIFTDNATYFKNDEIVFTEGNSKAINKDGLIITATKFNYNKIKNILDASGNVKVVDPSKNTIIYSNKITYFKNKEKIFTNGDTEALVEDKYKFFSKDVIFYRNEMKLISDNYSTIDENKLNLYELERFKYFLNDKVLKGEEAKVITNLNNDKSDEFYFKSIFISFKNPDCLLTEGSG